MCTVSAIVDQGMTIPMDNWFKPAVPGLQETAPAIEMAEVIRLLKRIDEKLEQKNCPEPDKVEWLMEFQKRLRQLEQDVQERIWQNMP